jgi:hypothetical protein
VRRVCAQETGPERSAALHSPGRRHRSKAHCFIFGKYRNRPATIFAQPLFLVSLTSRLYIQFAFNNSLLTPLD